MSAPALQPAAAAPPAKRRRRVEYHLVWLVLAGIVVTLAATMSVQGGGLEVALPGMSQSLPELCHSRRIFGIDCPGCGLTRCFISLAHGDVAAAARYNFAGVFLFAIVAAQLPFRAWQIFRLSRGQDEWRVPYQLTSAIAILLSVTMLVQWGWKLWNLAAA